MNKGLPNNIDAEKALIGSLFWSRSSLQKGCEDIEKEYFYLDSNAKIFEVNRRDFKNLCDDVCILLGNRLEELCKYSRIPVIVKPSKYDDYCPMNSENLVVYGNHREGERFSYDGKRYVIVDTKLESCPYYNIYCNSFEEDI